MKKNPIAGRIDLIRRECGLNQQQFAEALGISQAAVSKYLGARTPPADILLKIARLGNTTIEWLLSAGKSYISIAEAPAAHETNTPYDAEYRLAQKIASLNSEARQAVNTLVDQLCQAHTDTIEQDRTTDS